MKSFSTLCSALETHSSPSGKAEALAAYLRTADESDKVWAIALLSHHRPKRSVSLAQIRNWAGEMADIPPWLFEESVDVVGDLAETIALILPPPTTADNLSLTEWIHRIQALKGREEAVQRAEIRLSWYMLDRDSRFLFNKLLTGAFRTGVSRKILARALAKVTGLPEHRLALQLTGDWDPDHRTFTELIDPGDLQLDPSLPYPFMPASPLEGSPIGLGSPEDWIAERKFDGIRGQLIRRAGRVFLWTREEELVTDRFPELEEAAASLPDGTVLDGEILPFHQGKVLPCQNLKTRIGRRKVTRNLRETVPVIFMVFDCLETEGRDIRHCPQTIRRGSAERLIREVASPYLLWSETLAHDGTWDGLARIRETSRDLGWAGLMLKRCEGRYVVEQPLNGWWTWKAEPFTLDVVLLYAQAGQGMWSHLNAEYTFGLWDGEELVPFARTDSGLTDQELEEVDRFVRENTLESFGPVRRVEPVLVFELAFDGVQASRRHKCGVTVRFPRIVRWHKDRPAMEAHTLMDLKALIPGDE